MTRTSSILILALSILGVFAVPAAASDGYRSVDSVVAGSGPDRQPVADDTDLGTLKPLLATAPESGTGSVSGGGDYRSVDSVLAGQRPAQSPTSLSGGSDYRSVDSIVADLRPPQTAPVRTVESPADDGFGWSDALIGALAGAGLLLITLAAARSVARHRRRTAESHA